MDWSNHVHGKEKDFANWNMAQSKSLMVLFELVMKPSSQTVNVDPTSVWSKKRPWKSWEESAPKYPEAAKLSIENGDL